MSMMRKLFRPAPGQVHEGFAAFGILAGEGVLIGHSTNIRADVSGVDAAGEFADIGAADFILIETSGSTPASEGGYTGVCCGLSTEAGNADLPNNGLEAAAPPEDQAALSDSVVVCQVYGVRSGALSSTAQVSNNGAFLAAVGALDDVAGSSIAPIGHFLTDLGVPSTGNCVVWLK